MKRLLSCALLTALAAAPAVAEDTECVDFGLNNAYLQELFCAQLREIGDEDLGTRSANIAQDDAGTAGEVPPWAELPVLQDAYRADPATTLELIQRIKNAGGGLELLQ